jgi:hypothetical protein
MTSCSVLLPPASNCSSTSKKAPSRRVHSVRAYSPLPSACARHTSCRGSNSMPRAGASPAGASCGGSREGQEGGGWREAAPLAKQHTLQADRDCCCHCPPAHRHKKLSSRAVRLLPLAGSAHLQAALHHCEQLLGAEDRGRRAAAGGPAGRLVDLESRLCSGPAHGEQHSMRSRRLRAALPAASQPAGHKQQQILLTDHLPASPAPATYNIQHMPHPKQHSPLAQASRSAATCAGRRSATTA